MADEADIDAYCERISYTGPRTPTLDTLRAIHLRHTHAIPFENLDPLLKRPIGLDLASLERKLVHEGRGGYCFEHNLLLAHVLRELGYSVSCLAARAQYNAPEGLIRPRTHMVLLVDLEGVRYLADVGFGGLTLTAPICLQADTEQTTPHEPVRVIAIEGEYLLQALVKDTWKPLFRFDLQKQLPTDYEVASWYMSTHPQSPLVNNLMTARTEVDRRYGLFNNTLSVHHLRGGTEQRTLTSSAEVRAVLEKEFKLRLPDDPALDDVLAARI